MSTEQQVAGLPPVALDLLLRTAAAGAASAPPSPPLPRAPAWAMRQAGRYLPEFRALRAKHDFFAICHTPALCCEATLQPLRRFPQLDAVVIFSDILIVPQAMGLEVRMQPGPFFPRPLRAPADVEALLARRLLPADCDAAFASLYAGIELTRRTAASEGRAVPVIGFCGGPWTLMTYMIGDPLPPAVEAPAVAGAPADTPSLSPSPLPSSSSSSSSSSAAASPLPPNPAAAKDDGSHERARLWLMEHPAASHALLSALADVCAELLVGQWRAGASVLQVFESSAGDLPPRLFARFALPYMLRVAAAVRARTPAVLAGGPPLIAFARNAHQAGVLEALCGSAFDCISLDWLTEPGAARRRVAAACARLGVPRKALQGNLDPSLLLAAPAVLVRETHRMLRRFGARQPLVANLGHGMHPAHRPRQLALFFEAVHQLSARIRAKAAAACGQQGKGEEEEAWGGEDGDDVVFDAEDEAFEAQLLVMPLRMAVPAEFAQAEGAAAISS